MYTSQNRDSPEKDPVRLQEIRALIRAPTIQAGGKDLTKLLSMFSFGLEATRFLLTAFGNSRISCPRDGKRAVERRAGCCRLSHHKNPMFNLDRIHDE